MTNWRPDNWINPFHNEYKLPNEYMNLSSDWKTEVNIYEAGADAMLEAIKPLIKRIAPSSKLMDILEVK